MRNPTFCICENRPRSALGTREADQCLSFRLRDSTILLLSNHKILSLYSSSVAVQPGLCRTNVGNQNVGFLIMQLNFD